MKNLSDSNGSIGIHMSLVPGLVLGALIMSTQAQNSAQGDALARVSLSIPEAVKTAGVVMLEIAITKVRTPMLRNAGGVVWLGGMEVGRFSIMPTGGEQRYQFNVGTLVHQLGLAGVTANVEVAIINRDGGGVPAGSALMVSNAHIVIR
jgi:hypothetical protein